nr:hypothetical protein [Sphingomonas sp.]
MTHSPFVRRHLLVAIAATASLPLLSACAQQAVAVAPMAPAAAPAPVVPAATAEAQALALLDSAAENLLRLSPEAATSLGIDTGARAQLRHKLSDRSAQGQAQVAALLRT